MSYYILLVLKLCPNNLPANVCTHVFIFLTMTVENQKMLVSVKSEPWGVTRVMAVNA